MRLFKCPNCSQTLFYENSHCEQCGYRLGFDPIALNMRAMTEVDGGGTPTLWSDQDGQWKFCLNEAERVCNWLIPAADEAQYCLACRHNRLIPDLAAEENRRHWCALEVAKHRLFYALLRWNLPMPLRAENPEGLVFDFPAETQSHPHVLTGHDNGVVTIALKEGDAVERERMREQMGELYRTPLGHFRHEIGHYYWDRLVRDTDYLEPCRRVFGDERADYEQALRDHYANPPKPDWQNYFVSAYAVSHPWEDFAETWAHYLHIVDTLETASAFGMTIRPVAASDASLQARIDFDPYAETDVARIEEAWLPLAFAVNSLNRAMGQSDFYPFVLSPAVMRKLGFIHALIHQLPAAA